MSWGIAAPADGDENIAAANGNQSHDKFDAFSTHEHEITDYLSKHANDHDTGGFFTCNNCGQEGHKARECPEEKRMTGECFSCGQVGHNKAECPNVKPATCKNCGQEGHLQSACEAPRKLNREGVADMTPHDAWNMLKKAAAERDMDDVKAAFAAFSMAEPTLTYLDIEERLRQENVNLYLIACKKEMPVGFTNVDLQGKAECENQITYSWTAKPRRPRMMNGWPDSVGENTKRLADCGEAMTTLKPVCRRCGELGHTSKACEQERVEPEGRIEIKCDNCNELGHRLRDCKQPRVNRNACKNCNEEGHRASECKKPRDESSMECRKCGAMGHSGRNCPEAEQAPRGCRNCGEEGHMARECEKPQDPSTIQCRNCDEYGHMSRACPQPRDYSRVKCTQCGEMGHTKIRCKQPVAGAEGDHGFGGGEVGGFEDDRITKTIGDWDTAAPATPQAQVGSNGAESSW